MRNYARQNGLPSALVKPIDVVVLVGRTLRSLVNNRKVSVPFQYRRQPQCLAALTAIMNCAYTVLQIQVQINTYLIQYNHKVVFGCRASRPSTFRSGNPHMCR